MAADIARVAVDVMGGDHGPSVTIPACVEAFRRNDSLKFKLYGDQAKIAPYLDQFPVFAQSCNVHHTTVMIENSTKPSQAIRMGKESSMRLALDAVANGEADCCVSAGNTGALMATSKLVLKCLPGIHRPAIASIFPTIKGQTLVLDLGANLHCGAENLVQFAVLGAVYARIVMGIERPSVGLLNVGSEDMKGHDVLKAASTILASVQFPGQYHGFVEGDDITAGTVDVVVTDGFTGNVALKTAEGVGKMVGHFIKDEFRHSLAAKFGYFFCWAALKRVKQRMDPRMHNGGLFLGLNGICVKSHGGTDQIGFTNAIERAAAMAHNKFNDRVAVEIEELSSQEDYVSITNQLIG